MSNARFFFLYRYLLENTCEGHTAKGEDIRAQYKTLPATLADAKAAARASEFIASSLPRTVIEYYTK